jgi:hypothetical protein
VERKAAEAALEKPWEEQTISPATYNQTTQPQPRPQAPPLKIQPIQSARMAPPTSAHSPTSARPNLWNPHNAMQSFEGLARSPSTSSKASSTRAPSTRTVPTAFSATNVASVRPKGTLTSIQTSLPTAPPQARFSPQSAAAARFSPHSASDYYSTPTSAGSTAPLLKIKPYNPADFVSSGPSTGPGMDTTPMGVERRFFAAGSPTVVTLSPSMASASVPIIRSPVKMAYQGGWPLPAGATQARSPPPPPSLNRNQSPQSQSSAIVEEREYKNRFAPPKGR